MTSEVPTRLVVFRDLNSNSQHPSGGGPITHINFFGSDVVVGRIQVLPSVGTLLWLCYLPVRRSVLV